MLTGQVFPRTRTMCRSRARACARPWNTACRATSTSSARSARVLQAFKRGCESNDDQALPIRSSGTTPSARSSSRPGMASLAAAQHRAMHAVAASSFRPACTTFAIFARPGPWPCQHGPRMNSRLRGDRNRSAKTRPSAIEGERVSVEHGGSNGGARSSRWDWGGTRRTTPAILEAKDRSRAAGSTGAPQCCICNGSASSAIAGDGAAACRPRSPCRRRRPRRRRRWRQEKRR